MCTGTSGRVFDRKVFKYFKYHITSIVNHGFTCITVYQTIPGRNFPTRKWPMTTNDIVWMTAYLIIALYLIFAWISSFLCVPSQKGRRSVCLQLQNQYSLVSGATNRTGRSLICKKELLCVPSQNGWLKWKILLQYFKIESLLKKKKLPVFYSPHMNTSYRFCPFHTETWKASCHRFYPLEADWLQC